ncbi:hypothetical protein [Kumtagia ephedrae]|uniref:Uncharacterized protein n=1 Tax=Kumtagia ephedrae TaxID=2116701 RepID=A0A2P7S1K7_9HYPH|nr:hypothetical protein [Mesorhizobium ephedrae]PSJ56364.1 hypothetical protein C7I84_21075 [Mesorhizobium ephedrae]
MRIIGALAAWLSVLANLAAAAGEQVTAIQGEIPTLKRIAEVCNKAVHGEVGSDPNLPAILVQEQCNIQWPSLLVLPAACPDRRAMEKCISDTFDRSFPLPLGAPRVMLSRCDDADACFDVYEAEDPYGNGTRRPEVCGYEVSGKAIVRTGKIYVAIADLAIVPVCWENNG